MRAVRAVGSVLSKILTVLMAVLLAVNVYTIIMRRAVGVRQPSVFGFSSAVVLSGSMAPEINVDDMVIIRRQSSYEVSDIVMYEGETSLITHRIVEKTDGAYVTRGDANNADDPPVPAERVVGKVVAVIPKAGKLVVFLQSPLGMLLLVLTGAAILLLPARRKTAPSDEGGVSEAD